MAVPSSLARQVEVNHLMVKLEFCWSHSVLSFIMAIRLSTQRVWHTINSDVTVSNGVNLCRPEVKRYPYPLLQQTSMEGVAISFNDQEHTTPHPVLNFLGIYMSPLH